MQILRACALAACSSIGDRLGCGQIDKEPELRLRARQGRATGGAGEQGGEVEPGAGDARRGVGCKA
jgi:hypothetical protein